MELFIIEFKGHATLEVFENISKKKLVKMEIKVRKKKKEKKKEKERKKQRRSCYSITVRASAF